MAHPSMLQALLEEALAEHQKGNIARAAEHYEALLRHAPDHPDALHFLGVAASQMQQPVRAETLIRRAIAVFPGNPVFFVNLANTIRDAGDAARLPEVEASLRQALAISPDLVAARHNLGNLLYTQGRIDEAASQYAALLTREPGHDGALAMLARVWHESGRYSDALALNLRTLELPLPPARRQHLLQTIAATSFQLGDHAAGRLATQSALDHAISIHYAAGFSAALVQLQFDSTRDATQIARLHRAWDRHFALPLATTIHTPQNDRTADRVLRLGYVYGDLATHPMGRFAASLLAAHGAASQAATDAGFEVHLYSTAQAAVPLAGVPDSRFHEVSSLSDQALVERIEADGIDLLIELSGHAEGNRLMALARRPAPLQLSWFGHFGTTGLSTIDARISDALADPVGEPTAADDPVLRLAAPFLSCQLPAATALPAAGRRPAEDANRVVFGYCGGLAHLDDSTLDLWSQLLAARPGSQLRIVAQALADPPVAKRLTDRFGTRGVDSGRLQLSASGGSAWLDWEAVDIGLDSVVCAAGSMVDALAAGVPVVSLAGQRHAQRIGASILAAAGLDELIAWSPDEFLGRALRLANDRPALEALRTALASRVRAAPLANPEGVLRALERALRLRWVAWCEGSSNSLATQTPEWAIAVAGGVSIVVPATFESMTPFVLLEQEDWFEDEIRFVRQLLEPGWTVLDIGANFGLYATACGRRVGPAGRVFAFEPAPNTARFLARSCALNRLDNVHIVETALSDCDGEAWIALHPNPELNRLVATPAAGLNVERVPVATLDRWCADRAAQGQTIMPDFIKLDAEGHEHQVLDGGARLLARSSPIILFEIKHGSEFNYGLAEHFCRLGFDLYRLIPGLGLLTPAGPVNAATPADAFLLNLFAIKPDRARQLEIAGRLVASPVPDTGRPPYWRAALQGQALPPALEALWMEERWMQQAGGAAHAHCLSRYAAAHDQSRRPAERLACLQQALADGRTACDANATPGRLLTLGRIAVELGQLALADMTARRALTSLAATPGDPASIDEPLLPGAFLLGTLDPANPLPWLRASLLERHLKTGSFGGCFDNFDEQAAKLDQLVATGFVSDEMLRRQQLVHLCLGKPLAPAALTRLSVASAGNLNAGYWAQLSAAG